MNQKKSDEPKDISEQIKGNEQNILMNRKRR